MLQSANVEFLADICTLFGGHQEACKLETNWKLLLDQHIGKSKGFGVDGWGGVWYLVKIQLEVKPIFPLFDS